MKNTQNLVTSFLLIKGVLEFTNWDTIQNSIKRLKKIEDILENQSQSYTKELLKFQNTAEKLNKSIG